jgi:hypothetical protein
MHGVVAGGVGDIGQPALPGIPAGGEPVVQFDRRGSSIGSGNGASICTRPPVSSAHAAEIPRGRPSLTLVAILCTPCASSAEASVSPRWPCSATVEREFVTGAAVDAATRWGAERRGHEITGFGSPMR